MQIKISIIVVFLMVWGGLVPEKLQAQEIEPEQEAVQETVIMEEAPDSTVAVVVIQADSVAAAVPLPDMKEPFKPNPTRAVLYSAICPGLGQIYNRKYWKLPLVYGSFMGCIYAVTWNNKNLKDYSQAYKDIMSDDPVLNNSWQNFLPYGANPEEYIHNSNFQDRLKRQKDYYRRYRDLSIIITGLVYFICMIDAYVDAQLFDFDISPNLSMRVVPIMEEPTNHNSRSYGVGCSINF